MQSDTPEGTTIELWSSLVYTVNNQTLGRCSAGFRNMGDQQPWGCAAWIDHMPQLLLTAGKINDSPWPIEMIQSPQFKQSDGGAFYFGYPSKKQKIILEFVKRHPWKLFGTINLLFI